MKKKISGLLAILALAAGVPLYAHHSFAAEFDGSRSVRLTGNTVNWGCEGAGPGALTRRGRKKGDVKLGDTLIVDGYPANDGSHLIDARRVTLPDGRTVSGGSAGDGGPGDADSLTAVDPAKAKK